MKVNGFNVPPSWGLMGWCEKAGYLCSSRQARDYPDACAKLKKMPKPRVVPTVARIVRLPYAD